MSREEQLSLYSRFKDENVSSFATQNFPYGCLKPKNINAFRKFGINQFLKDDISNFERDRDPEIFVGDRIIFNRTGTILKAIYTNQKIYFDFDLHCLKLEDETLYYLVVAILNSNLTNYYLDLFYRKRINGSFPKIGHNDILNIPIPKELDETLFLEISELSKNLSEGKYQYSEKEGELNELIYDLYDLSYWERQRVKDYFIAKSNIGRKKNALTKYKETLKQMIDFYTEKPIHIEETATDFDLIVVKISFSANNSENPDTNKTKKYLLNEIFEQNPNENFLASQEKIYGRSAVYIIKKAKNKNWTKTKAFEDAQDILKRLIPN